MKLKGRNLSKKLGEVDTAKIVYVDEAGFDNREDDGYGDS